MRLLRMDSRTRRNREQDGDNQSRELDRARTPTVLSSFISSTGGGEETVDQPRDMRGSRRETMRFSHLVARRRFAQGARLRAKRSAVHLGDEGARARRGGPPQRGSRGAPCACPSGPLAPALRQPAAGHARPPDARVRPARGARLRRGARATAQRLRAYPEHFAIHYSILCEGSVPHLLGMLALLSSRPGDAIPLLEAGIGMSERAGFGPCAADARWRLALALAQQGNAGDRTRARALAKEAQASALRFGMRALARETEQLPRGWSKAE